MKAACLDMAIFILMITLQYMSHTYCAEDEDDLVPTPILPRGKKKLLKMFPTDEDLLAAEIIRSLRRGKEVMTHQISPSGEGISSAAASSGHKLERKRRNCSSTYHKWTNEMNDDLLYLYYHNLNGRLENWDEIEEFFRQKYGKYISRRVMQQHLKNLVTRMIFNTPSQKRGKIKGDSRIDIIRIYYQTKNEDESGHGDRMLRRWLQENPGNQELPFPNLKSYVEERLKTIRKVTSGKSMKERAEKSELNSCYNWTTEHEANLLEIWNSFPPDSRNRMKELHRIMSERFTDMEQLPSNRLYKQLRNLLRREKRVSERSKSKD